MDSFGGAVLTLQRIIITVEQRCLTGRYNDNQTQAQYNIVISSVR